MLNLSGGGFEFSGLGHGPPHGENMYYSQISHQDLSLEEMCTLDQR